MVTKYIAAAMQEARYNVLSDGTCFGEIPGFDSLYGHGTTLEACREDLQAALESWIVVSLWDHDPMPVVGGIDLQVVEEPDEAEQTAAERPAPVAA